MLEEPTAKLLALKNAIVAIGGISRFVYSLPMG